MYYYCSKQHDTDQKPSQETRKRATAEIGATTIDNLAGSNTTSPSPSLAKEAAIGCNATRHLQIEENFFLKHVTRERCR